MSAAITELSAARAARPAPDPLFWPAGEPAAGRPLLATPVPAGFPSPADDFVERRLSLDEHLIRHPVSTFLLRVSGDCLAGAGVHDVGRRAHDHGDVAVLGEDAARVRDRVVAEPQHVADGAEAAHRRRARRARDARRAHDLRMTAT